jgi:hypothetical protein
LLFIRKIFTKIFICVDFPDSYLGIRFFDAWTKKESGGIPLNSTEKEMRSFAKNPQYYISVKKETNIQITLIQNDGRLTSHVFPYTNYFVKNCMVLTPVNFKQKLESFEDKKLVEITVVGRSRENTIIKILSPGQYILSICSFNEGDIGNFCLQFNFEDSFVDNDINDKNFLKKLKSVEIERLNDIDRRVKCKIKLFFYFF